MALSITELELQSTEYLPAREVMSALARPGNDDDGIHGMNDGHVSDGNDGNEFEGGLLNGLNLSNLVNDIDVEEIQVGLVNVMLEDINDTLDLGTYNDDEISQIED